MLKLKNLENMECYVAGECVEAVTSNGKMTVLFLTSGKHVQTQHKAAAVVKAVSHSRHTGQTIEVQDD